MNVTAYHHKVLTLQIRDLGFTEDFKYKADQMGFTHLQQVVVMSQVELENKPGFDEDWMEELIQFATTCGFLELLDDEDRW